MTEESICMRCAELVKVRVRRGDEKDEGGRRVQVQDAADTRQARAEEF